MVNMNHLKEPAVYGLKDQDGGFFYVGRTTGNAQNRLWEHRSRARAGHASPVYQRIRELDPMKVGVEVLQLVGDGEDARLLEAEWIKKLIDEGHDLVNVQGRDGKPDSWSEERRAEGLPDRKGKPTWIRGLSGEAAGWTEERRKAQSERSKAIRAGTYKKPEA